MINLYILSYFYNFILYIIFEKKIEKLGKKKEEVTELDRFLFLCYRNGKRFDKSFIVGAVLMDLSMGFDCIPHDLIIAKLVYGMATENLRLIYY